MCYNEVGDRDVHPKAVTSRFPLLSLIFGVWEENMEKKCNNCGAGSGVAYIPFVVYQATAARQERQIRRMWIVILFLICALIGTNIAWVIYENSFEDVVTSEEIIVDAQENGIANYIGQDGNIYNGKDNNKESNQNS